MLRKIQLYLINKYDLSLSLLTVICLLVLPVLLFVFVGMLISRADAPYDDTPEPFNLRQL